MDWTTMTAGGPGTQAAGLLMAGAVAGLAAGILNAGGGIVLVAALYLALAQTAMAEEIRLPVAAATALAASLPTTLTLLQTARPKDAPKTPYRVRELGFGAVAGGIGGVLCCFAPAPVYLGTFALMIVFAATVLFFETERPSPWALRERPRAAAVWVAKLGFAGLGTFSGLGSATLTTFVLKRTRPASATATALAFEAVAAAAAVIAMVAVGFSRSGLTAHALGYVNLAAFAVAAPAMFLTATFTAGYGKAASERAGALRKIFALFVLVSAGRMIWQWLNTGL